MTFTKEDLLSLEQEHDSFVGIDSDGCVFDTMETKQKLCFHGIIISHWGLEPIEKCLRETAEFVNLYSVHRGNNRFRSLLILFDMLRARPEVIRSGVTLPVLSSLRRFVDSGLPLGDPELEKQANAGDAELEDVLAWSRKVNEEIGRVVRNIPPFKWVVQSLARIKRNSDAICVSQTPAEALVREWKEHDLLDYVKAIAGQELGTKTEHLRMATGGYATERILMIGDAPGDLKAARGVNALFYPINPGHESDSWRCFHDEAYDRFLAGTFAGEYETRLIAGFEKLLPSEPAWCGIVKRSRVLSKNL